MLLRGPDRLTYPSRKEFGLLGEVMHQMRSGAGSAELPSLTSVIGQLIPHQFAAYGAFHVPKQALQISQTNYNAELHHLYVTQGFVTDPTIKLLQMTNMGTVSSEDSPDLVIPREVTSLKLDFGIKECLSAGVRGVQGTCTYYLFSNFDKKLMGKLRTMMQILGPHFHLAYMRAPTLAQNMSLPSRLVILTHREEEIMRWVAEGKTNWEISIILHVSLNTVKFHLKNVYEKLGGVENRWAAVAQWQNSGSGSIDYDTKKQDRHEPTP